MIWWLAVLTVLGWPGLLVGVAVLHYRRRPRRRRRRGRSETDLIELCRIVRVGLAGGLNLVGSLEMAGERVDPSLGMEVEALLRRGRIDGIAQTLVTTQGRLQPLTAQLSRAQVTGAPLGPALDALLARLESEARGRSLERIRSMPVKLIVPVSLLLLPGFVLVVVAPSALDQIGSLLGGLGG